MTQPLQTLVKRHLVRGAWLIFISMTFFLFSVAPVMAATVGPQNLDTECIGPFADCAVYDTECTTTDASASATTKNRVFMVGDSISVGAKDKMSAALTNQGIESKIDASTSRSINGNGIDGNKLSGLEALKASDNTDSLKNANAIVIQLGTNKEANLNRFKAGAKDVMDYIKSENSTAKRYWVNLFSDVSHKDSYNSALEDLASDLGFTVIDTTQSNIQLGSDNLHPTPGGSQKFSKTVVDSIEYGDTGVEDSPGTSGCCPVASESTTSSTKTDKGNDSQIAFEFFVEDKSTKFSKAGAAGIVGNLMRETGGDQYDLDPESGITSRGSGYKGIAQWSGSRWSKVVRSYAKGEDVKKLETQLMLIAKELKEKPYSSLIPKLKSATDPKQAAHDFNDTFEIGDGGDQRARNAQRAYDEFKDKILPGSDAIEQGTAQCCSAGSVGSSSDLDKFLKVLAFQESGGNPNQPGSAGQARGKYQYIDSTWASSTSTYYPPAGKYSQAHLAPESMQDAVVYLEYAKKFKDLNNDIFKLAVSHFLPAANSEPWRLDVVPDKNEITPREYANKLINTMKSPGGWERIPLKYTEAPEFATWAAKVSADASGGGGGVSCSEGGADSEGVDDIRWPLAKSIYDKNPGLFTKPHHTYPAVDIIIPSGTKVNSMTSGKVVVANNSNTGRCGVMVIIQYTEKIQITYCHGTVGSIDGSVTAGKTVRPGQFLMDSGNTGRSSAPHLHIEIELNGKQLCPQSIFRDLASNKKPDLEKLPASGCVAG